MSAPRLWGIVPAAGIGRRMGADTPKQYLKLGDRTILEHTLAALDSTHVLAGIVVSIASDDPYWPHLAPPLSCALFTAHGGSERAESVLNALDVLRDHASDEDWVLVHDAARPCVRIQDVTALIDALEHDAVGGLLAIPLGDTMKQANAQQRSVGTVDRRQLWHALTPQMFRVGALRSALRAAVAAGVTITDDASAMEQAGFQPRLVEGHADNLKITRPEDLALAEFYLRQLGRL